MAERECEQITMTDLLRQPAAVLDEVELDGRSFVLHRYGHPVARIEPIESVDRRPRARVRRLRQQATVEVPVEPAIDEEYAAEVLAFPPARRLLNAIAEKGRAGWYTGEGEGWFSGLDFAKALGSLELAGLVRRDRLWYWATNQGIERAGG